MKIVINRCFGGYGLSYDAIMRYLEIKGTVAPSSNKATAALTCLLFTDKSLAIRWITSIS